jgi:type IV pilus assembly protein PilV
MRKISNSQGFTLLELLVAMTIFAIGLLSVASMQITALRENANSQGRTVAVSIAAGVLEEIQNWAPNDPRLQNVVGMDWTFPGGDTLQLAGGGTFRATYDVARNYNGVMNIIRIQVNVRGGITRPISLVGFKRAV